MQKQDVIKTLRERIKEKHHKLKQLRTLISREVVVESSEEQVGYLEEVGSIEEELDVLKLKYEDITDGYSLFVLL